MKAIIFLSLVTLMILSAMLMIAPPGILDSRFYYSAETASAFFHGLSADESGRYLLSEILDLLFIMSYTSTLALVFRRFSLSKVSAFVPGTLDLIESIPIVLCLMGWLKIESLPFLGILTLAKWSSVGIVGGYAVIRTVLRRRLKSF